MTREELRDYVDEQRALDNIPYHVYSAIIDGIDTLEQEPSITWVTGADGAKIAFCDVPVWKVTKICEILCESQESEVEE